jgi:hypothetical protein
LVAVLTFFGGIFFDAWHIDEAVAAFSIVFMPSTIALYIAKLSEAVSMAAFD